MRKSFVRLEVEGFEARENPSSFWNDNPFGAFLSGAGHGVVNMATGVWMVAHDLVAAPIDLLATSVDAGYTAATGNSLQWEPVSYYG